MKKICFSRFIRTMSVYSNIIIAFLRKTEEELELVSKKTPLVCQKLYQNFKNLPTLPSVKLTTHNRLFSYPHENEIKEREYLTILFHSITKANTFTDIQSSLRLFLQQMKNMNSDSVRLGLIVCFIIQIYMDYIQYVSTYNIETSSISLILCEDTLKELQEYKNGIDSVSVSCVDRFISFGSYSCSYYKEHNAFPPMDINLQNLFFQLYSFQPFPLESVDTVEPSEEKEAKDNTIEPSEKVDKESVSVEAIKPEVKLNKKSEPVFQLTLPFSSFSSSSSSSSVFKTSDSSFSKPTFSQPSFSQPSFSQTSVSQPPTQLSFSQAASQLSFKTQPTQPSQLSFKTNPTLSFSQPTTQLSFSQPSTQMSFSQPSSFSSSINSFSQLSQPSKPQSLFMKSMQEEKVDKEKVDKEKVDKEKVDKEKFEEIEYDFYN